MAFWLPSSLRGSRTSTEPTTLLHRREKLEKRFQQVLARYAPGGHRNAADAHDHSRRSRRPDLLIARHSFSPIPRLTTTPSIPGSDAA